MVLAFKTPAKYYANIFHDKSNGITYYLFSVGYYINFVNLKMVCSLKKHYYKTIPFLRQKE